MRGADPREVWKWMKYYYTKRRLRLETVIRYAMTPNALGGFGLSPYSQMYPFIEREWDGKWVKIKREFKYKEIEANLGAWRGRLLNLGFDASTQNQ
ncbi:MAG: hypothetical protein GY696_18410 [Gammaproteobacteria bacterium]|nr:hypothetical protein [Gammaproteobacteria bacterium]